MIHHGLKPVRPDHRDFSHSRTFGSITQFPDEFDTDAGMTNPDQNADGLPYGCTGYTQAELCTDEDKLVYKPKYTYEKTCLMEGHDDTEGCDIRTSLKSLLVYGAQETTETSDMEAFQHRRGAYYAVEPVGDYFDGIRSALMKSGSVSVGTPWYWNFTSQGIVTAPSSYENDPYSWHNWKVCGWKTINGQPYLKAKPWIGEYRWFPRDVINHLLSQTYTGAFVVDRFQGENTQLVEISLYETVLSYLYRALELLKLR
jgi:hypothetical protein